MAPIGNTHRSPGRRSRWLILLALTVALAAGRPAAQTQPDALSFFKNYFITGDYVVGGVGLRGLGGVSGVQGIARGSIYHQRGTGQGGHRRGISLLAGRVEGHARSRFGDGRSEDSTAFRSRLPADPSRKSWFRTAPPLLELGRRHRGLQDGQHRTYTYRADVLRFLPVDASGNWWSTARTSSKFRIPDRRETRFRSLSVRAWSSSTGIHVAVERHRHL